MEHVVFFPAPDGLPAFRRVAALEDAVRLVEHLRNVEGVAELSVHALGNEVPLAFRTWYRVEVPADDAAAPVVPEQKVAEATLVPAVSVPAEPAVFDVPVAEAVQWPAEPEAVPAVVDPGHTGHPDGVKSLGFFAT